MPHFRNGIFCVFFTNFFSQRWLVNLLKNTGNLMGLSHLSWGIPASVSITIACFSIFTSLWMFWDNTLPCRGLLWILWPGLCGAARSAGSEMKNIWASKTDFWSGGAIPAFATNHKFLFASFSMLTIWLRARERRSFEKQPSLLYISITFHSIIL